VSSGTARAALLGGLCGAAGWLLFAGAFVAGIAVVVVRAAHGSARLGEMVLAVTPVQRAQLQVGQAAAAIGQLLTTVRTARRLLWLAHAHSPRQRGMNQNANGLIKEYLPKGAGIPGYMKYLRAIVTN
jgi:hypothetical protein